MGSAAEDWRLSTEGDYPSRARGSRAHGSSKMTCIDNIKSWNDLSLEMLLRETKNRSGWNEIVRCVADTRIEDG